MTDNQTLAFRRPPRSNREAVFSWIAVGLGLCGLLSSFGDSGVVDVLSSIIFSAGIALPGAMWLWYEEQDKKACERARRDRELDRYLTETDRLLLGRVGPREPELVHRRWGPIWIAALVLLSVGGSLDPSPSTGDPGSGHSVTVDHGTVDN
ncbi:hypothetical protein OS127_02370 [Corynebacterium sp. P6129]|uniref:hypothetical protein n=1 Tax=Corynebacterium antarcticum TaxID=2800405 RepID=UPI002260A02E|nr:hypothetical protein [Corynebacterium antarcticum]MCX7491372.1 hypothetical protein [Corynebacterium antarcticum]